MANEHPSQLGHRVTALEERLRALQQERLAADEACYSGDFSRKASHDKDLKDLQDAHKKDAEKHEKAMSALRDRHARKYKRRVARAEKAFESLRGRSMRERQNQANLDRQKLQEAEERIVAEEKQKTDLLSEQHDDLVARIGTMREKAGVLKGRVESLAVSFGEGLPDLEAPLPQKEGEWGDPLPFVDGLAERLSEAGLLYRRVNDGLLSSLGKRIWTLVAFLLIGLGHVVALVFIVQRSQPPVYIPYLIGSALVSILLLHFLTRAMRLKACRAVRKLYEDLRDILASLVRQEQVEKDRFWSQSKNLMDERIARVLKFEEGINAESAGFFKQNEQLLADFRARFQRLLDRNKAKEERARAELEAVIAEKNRKFEQEHEGACKKRQDQYKNDQGGAESKRANVARRAQAGWKEGLEVFAREMREALTVASATHSSWEALAAEATRMPAAFPREVMLGQVALPLKKLDVSENADFPLPELTAALPLSLVFPGAGSLLVQAGAAGRDRALHALFASALRILASFPPGMAHLTIVDPVALGQGFSAFMQLADFDEALIGGRIWTDAGHIDKCLADLTEHMEKVIQKYLRNRYATIDEYNAKAGDLKEPYRFLMISDFPSGLSDLSLERLASVVSSGPPCGVHVLMYHDTRQKWPAAVDLGQLRRNGIVLKEAGEGFVEAHEGLDRGRALVEPLPEMPVVNALLDKLGRRAVEAKRVELSFSTVSPPTPADMWSRDTERGLRVPIGRSGADRLQELELGRGTAQHALIAGRTGSGKSTLFHVMITNTALWFSPQEVEFYLIDFKKGVEFKTYATHRLPHARVVAVESDREFGLSVLKRLDKELDRRGELFRKAGVQDLPGYRRSPGAEEMPRTLLLIDEFQEFFTEDDSVAQEASLLLDRFVRQGRAFGVHTILGSQTLSGVYTLAKSTLGQMGVRIALQCNESDSYLILSEDNAAARLLSRPGEAIYNGMSGMIEGNNPFQIVWLPDEEEAARLKEIAKRTDAEGRRPKANTVVFEGNAPARLEANEALQAAVADRAPAARPALRAWLGEPNAIKGPTEVRFTDAGGSHLIMLGQHRDAAFGMTCATIFSLAARIPPEKLRLILLDGSGGEAEYVAHLDRLARALPHELSVVQHREIPALIGELDRELSASQESGQPPERHTFLFVFGLQRLRALRQEDDFSLSSSRDEAGSSGERFANLLREGPEQRLHIAVWCDTLANANRAFNRRTLREFDMRVLFQMSAADSSELIDTPAANTLGLHNALLFVESEGLLEKFRPYAIPDEAWFEKMRAAIHTKYTLGAKTLP